MMATLFDNCTGCNKRRVVDLIGFGRDEFPLCQSCRKIFFGDAECDLIELWARTGIRSEQVEEAYVVRGLKEAGIDCRYLEDADDQRILPEYQAARVMRNALDRLGAVRIQAGVER